MNPDCAVMHVLVGIELAGIIQEMNLHERISTVSEYSQKAHHWVAIHLTSIEQVREWNRWMEPVNLIHARRPRKSFQPGSE